MMRSSPSMAVLVAPGIYHQKNEYQETQNQQQDRPGLVFPKDSNVSGRFLKVHAEATYTSPGKSKGDLNQS